MEHNPEVCNQRFINVEGNQERDDSRLLIIEKAVSDIKEDLAVNNTNTKQMIESFNKVAIAIESISKTLADVNQNLTGLNNDQKSLKINQVDLKINQEQLEQEVMQNKIDTNEKLYEIENKGKIDVVVWIKDNFFKLGFFGGIVFFIIERLLK